MPTTEEFQLIIALLNWVVCSFMGWTSACRINLMEGDSTRRVFRANYALLFTTAYVSGFSPILFGEWPTISQVGVTAAFAFVLASGAPAWRAGIPAYARKTTFLVAGHPWRRFNDMPPTT